MQSVNIFIASSSRDTAHERAVVGDTVRMLSDKYESKGYRIHLNCWEDFAPEFTGVRKQTEYNEELIKKSQLFIALFRSVCGRYTQEEVKLWNTTLGHTPIVFDIQDPNAAKNEVYAFLGKEELDAVNVSNDDEIRIKVEELVADYVNKHPSTPHADTTPRKEIYATIPEDRATDRASFGNILRSVDDIAEKFFHYRCHLTQEDPNKIAASNYYAAILKDRVTPVEENEVLTAISLTKRLSQPHVMLYYNHGDAICANHPAIRTAISGNEIFYEPYDSLCRVKYNLVKWLLQQSLLRIDLKAGIDICDGWFIFYGLPVIPLTTLGIANGTALQQLTELIQHLSFAVLGVNTCSDGGVQTLSIADLDDLITRAQEVLSTSKIIEQAAQTRLQDLLGQVTQQIDFLLSEGVTALNINDLMALIQRKEQLQVQLQAPPQDILRTQMLIVQVHDTYTEAFAQTDIDIDQQYKKVADTADRYGIKNPTVEMMRMNYANYLSRQNKNQDALTLYEHVMTNLDALDNRSVQNRYYIMHLYVTYINQLSFLDERDRAKSTLSRLEAKEKEWEQYGIPESERIGNICRILACRLRMRPVTKDVAVLLNSAMSVYIEALSLPKELFDLDLREELYCDLPICIMSTMIDGYEYHLMPMNLLTSNMERLVNNVLEYTSDNPNEYSSMTYRGNAYHNMAYFLSIILGDQKKSRDYARKSLEVRREIYTLSNDPRDRYEIAETLLMLGATFVNNPKEPLSGLDYREALGYADECLSIYQTLNQEKFSAQETRVYQAVQLKGSIFYYGGEKAVGLSMLHKVWEWNKLHPDNSYAPVFNGVAGAILRKEGEI